MIRAWVLEAEAATHRNVSPRRQHGEPAGPQREGRREQFGGRDLDLPGGGIPLARSTRHSPRLTDLPTVEHHRQLFDLAAGPRDLPAPALRRQRRRRLREATQCHVLEGQRRKQTFPTRLPAGQFPR